MNQAWSYIYHRIFHDLGSTNRIAYFKTNQNQARQIKKNIVRQI